MEEIFNLIKERRSIRFYDQEREIYHEDILKILEAGHWAPSAKNSLPWFFVTIRDKELIKKIMTAPTPTRPEGKDMLDEPDGFESNLPKVIIAVFFEKEKSIFVDPKYYGNVDKTDFCNVDNYSYSDIIGIGCAIQNMALAAHSLGMGACITGDLLDVGPVLYDWLSVDNNKYQLMGGIRFGYSNKKGRSFRTPLSEHVRFI
jgi:nitroreductase